MAPDSAYQVYTLHGYVNGEGLALAWALLHNKSQQSYTEMFSAFADAFVRLFGDVGKRTFLTDFESAAINPIRATFPTSVVKGCTFHFRQALNRKLQSVSFLHTTLKSMKNLHCARLFYLHILSFWSITSPNVYLLHLTIV